MNNYEQLQEFLNKCIELGWKRNFINFTIEVIITPTGYINGIKEIDKYNEVIHSIHDIFSKESGLMEFVGWKIEPDHEEIYISESGRYVENNEYHYMIMGPMTAEEKITYFLENALLPTNTDA